MTLVGLQASSGDNLVSMMLSVQAQPQYQSAMAHRGNVIVTNACSEAGKSQHALSQQQQQQQQLGKKKFAQASPYSPGGPQPASVARRNARERNRVKQVNNGFATLRQHIPQSLAQAMGASSPGPVGSRAASKKLSKVETLRMAVEYIRSLQEVIEEHDSAERGDSPGGSLGSPARSADIKFELKSESGDEQYERPAAEASSSPTPSFASDSSSSGPSYGANFTTTIYSAPAAEAYGNYAPMSPEDKVLLDYISNNYMWTQ